jgi:hypothetical protein
MTRTTRAFAAFSRAVSRLLFAAAVATTLVALTSGNVSHADPSETTCFSVENSGMTAWWRAEGNAADSVGGHNGALQGNAGYAAGRIGQAFRFDGLGGWVSVPDSGGWAFDAADFSIDAWIYLDPIQGGDYTIVSQTQDADNWWRFSISYGRLRFQVNSVGGPPEVSVGSVVDTFPSGTWHHVAVTRTGVTTWAFYHDAVYLTPAHPSEIGFTSLGGPIPNLDADLQVGGWVNSGSFAGRIDGLEIFKGRALSQTDIAAIYGGKCSDMPSADITEGATPGGGRGGLGPAISSILNGSAATQANLDRAAAIAAPSAPIPPATASVTVIVRPPSTGDGGLAYTR